ncbi:hypothetical protein JOD24_000768 [Kroppenstedtia sanguinis]
MRRMEWLQVIAALLVALVAVARFFLDWQSCHRKK